jgi:flagellar biogenesis protein FliO
MASVSSSGVEPIWSSRLASLWQRVIAALPKIRVNRQRSLRLCESLSLGEKRIVAVIEYDDQRYLLAATPQNVSLLQSLGPARADEKSGN